MRNLALIGISLLALALGACGGDTLTGKSTGGGTGTSTASSVTALTSAPQIPSDGSSSATITALVRDSSNNVVPNVAVTFTADSGGLTVTQGTTDANGTATATLGTAGDATNRTITVKAIVGNNTATVPVNVVGTKLSVSGPTSLVQGSQGTFTISLTNYANAGIANQTVTLTSANGNTLSAASVTTDASGQQTFTVTAKNGGNDTITATALGIQAKQTVSVSNNAFAFTSPAANAFIPIGTTQPVIVNWTASGAAQTNQQVMFSSTRGTLSAASANTDGSGNAQVTITSTTAGPAVISASANGVSAQIPVTFLATNPTAINVQASPASITTQGKSTIVATVRDAQNNLVQNQTVNFTITQDSTGGSLSVASAVTDAQGQASTVYTASTTASATNGVVISATVPAQGTNPAITDSTALTVGGQTVFLSLGTGNKITPNSTQTQYTMNFTLTALDASSHAVPNIPVTLSIQSLAYYKGKWAKDSTGTWSLGTPTTCPSEDLNFNGILDPGEDGDTLTAAQISAGWVVNPNGNKDGKLEPGSVAAVVPGTATTDSNGQVNFQVNYPEDHAMWVAVKLTGSATVAGTESSTSTSFVLPILSSDVNATSSPPGEYSPYGVATVCNDPN